MQFPGKIPKTQISPGVQNWQKSQKSVISFFTEEFSFLTKIKFSRKTKNVQNLQNLTPPGKKFPKNVQNLQKFCKILQNFVKFCKNLQKFTKICKNLQKFTKICKNLQKLVKIFFRKFFEKTENLQKGCKNISSSGKTGKIQKMKKSPFFKKWRRTHPLFCQKTDTLRYSPPIFFGKTDKFPGKSEIRAPRFQLKLWWMIREYS